MKKRNTLLVLFIIAFSQLSFSQGQFTITGGAAVPSGDFMTNLDRNGYGLDISFVKKIGPTPLYIGLGGAFYGLGSNVEDHEFQAVITAGDMVIDQIPFHFQSNIGNKMFDGHLLARLVLPIPYIRPYVEGILGFNYFYTSTTITNLTDDDRFNDPDDNEVTSKTQLSDFAFSYGAGAGIQLKIGKSSYFDLKAVYTLGAEAEYYTKDDIDSWKIDFSTSIPEEEAEDFVPDLDALPKTSLTDIIFIQVGFTFDF